MTSTSSPTCPQCGTVIPEGAEHGLCPRCVFAKAMLPTADGAVPRHEPPDLDAVRAAFPHLEVISLIGSGGMGAVFKARQPQLDRFVALKILPSELASQPGFCERFQREAQALAKLSHPHIVTVHDFGQAGGFFYLLMEFVDGVNLRQLLQTKRLTSREALSIVPPVCEALQCAHDHGIVHRDIKPENLLIDREGRVKIADFGIAKMLRSEGDSPSLDYASAIREGESPSLQFGTPDYAAPEQHNGHADHRADIYSLGVVLYEMLTGERPRDNIVPPSKRVQVDVRIDEIVLRALEKTPELRFATAAEFRTQVEAATNAAGNFAAVPFSSGASKTPTAGWTLQRATWISAATGITCFFACLLAGIPFVDMFRVHKDSAYIFVVVVTLLASLFAGFQVWWSLKKEVAKTSTRWWFKPLSLVAFVAALPVVGFAIFFASQIPQGFNNPTPSEALLVPLSWIGAVLLPVAGIFLWLASRRAEPPKASNPSVIKGCMLALIIMGAVMMALIVLYFVIGRLSYSARQVAVAERAAVSAKLEAIRRAAQEEIQTARREAEAPAFVTRMFSLRHRLAREMADDLRQILLGTPGHEAKPSASNQEINVAAPPDVMARVHTFITVRDWPDKIDRGSNFQYPRQTVMRSARSFFYACAIEDADEVFSKLLSLHVLAELKGDTKSEHYFNYNTGGVPDPEWERSLRADWPGKKEAIQRLVREWNRYPLKRITEDSGIAVGFGVKHFCSVSFEGAPKEFYQITIEPDRTKPHGNDEPSFFFSSLPPWWKSADEAPAAPSPNQINNRKPK